MAGVVACVMWTGMVGMVVLNSTNQYTPPSRPPPSPSRVSRRNTTSYPLPGHTDAADTAVGPDLMILVLSAPDNRERRNLVRKIWTRSAAATCRQAGFSCVVRFFIGCSGCSPDLPTHMGKRLRVCPGVTSTLAKLLAAEHNDNQDLLVVDHHDTYKNSSGKFLVLLREIRRQFTAGAPMIAKVDDDVVVDMVGLMEHLLEDNPMMVPLLAHETWSTDFSTPPLWWGSMRTGSVLRRGRLGIDRTKVFRTVWPLFVRGTGWMMNGAMVRALADLEPDLSRNVWMEDTAFGMWVAYVATVRRSQLIKDAVCYLFDRRWGYFPDLFCVHSAHSMGIASFNPAILTATHTALCEGTFKCRSVDKNPNMPPVLLCGTDTEVQKQRPF